MSDQTRCSCLEVTGEDPACVLHGIGTDYWAQQIAQDPLARAEIVDTLKEHDRRVAELLAANNREVDRRRAAEDALRAVLDRITGHVAEGWVMPEGGTLGDFIRNALKPGA